MSRTQEQHPKRSWGKCRYCRVPSQEGEQLWAAAGRRWHGSVGSKELLSHLETAAQTVCGACSHAWCFSAAFALSVDNLQAGKEADENTGDGKGQSSCKEFPFHFSSRKTCLSTLKLILKPAVFFQTLHLNFPLHMNSSTLQMEHPA